MAKENVHLEPNLKIKGNSHINLHVLDNPVSLCRGMGGQDRNGRSSQLEEARKGKIWLDKTRVDIQRQVILSLDNTVKGKSG